MKGPYSVVIAYTIQPDGYFLKDAFQPSDTRLPDRMKIDTFRRVDISNNCTSRGLFKPGDKTVTGLRETCAEDWKYGDITNKTKDGKKKKSLAIFRQTGSQLYVHFFPGWWKNATRDRVNFICHYIENQ